MARLANKIALITGGASVPARLLSRRTLFAVIVSSILVFLSRDECGRGRYGL